MARRIFKSGNSLVVSLPRASLELLGLQEGSEVSVTVDQDGGRIIVQPAQVSLPGIESTFARQLEEFIEQYRPALEALAE
ncbi:AbrB/MazE/SpoVT family DNA-binding domain-containing protein [Sulfuriflexus sp.]|uniref:AbrB/MazE/SpoVT family DNA-binding domain-containing protein n=1 Tax=Sulfuriflexus sp. TaxID=2015443 RepID=UPI0028CE72BD|nr:AbrB/MazE/SpoVT family DNA-binding domain-containing protein [Sulfuriflexus sp.]MDT8405518.1 AbrB/MazE/SpoVT family DNA-binding domain-containing protein [Sulfuriflexus sp.]